MELNQQLLCCLLPTTTVPSVLPQLLYDAMNKLLCSWQNYYEAVALPSIIPVPISRRNQQLHSQAVKIDFDPTMCGKCVSINRHNLMLLALSEMMPGYVKARFQHAMIFFFILHVGHVQHLRGFWLIPKNYRTNLSRNDSIVPFIPQPLRTWQPSHQAEQFISARLSKVWNANPWAAFCVGRLASLLRLHSYVSYVNRLILH